MVVAFRMENSESIYLGRENSVRINASEAYGKKQKVRHGKSQYPRADSVYVILLKC
jgi:hypothetical protein